MAKIEEIIDDAPAPSYGKGKPTVADTSEIAEIELLVPLPLAFHVYVLPFLFLYPLAIWIYLFKCVSSL